MKQSTSTIQILIWLCAIGLAALVISRLPLVSLGASLSKLNLTNWIVWIFINVIIIVLLTSRWKSLTKAIGASTNFFSLLRVRQAGQLINFVTPGPQLGAEPLQTYWLWKRYYVPAHAALLTVGLDRFYEFWVNFAVLLLAVLVLFSSTTISLIDWRVVAAMLISLMLLMSLIAWIVLRKPILIRNFLKRLTSPWQKHKKLSELHSELAQFQELLKRVVTEKRYALLIALLVSLLSWVVMILEFWLLLQFVSVPIDVTTFIFLFVIVRLAFLLPFPGGIGTVEAALFWAFQSQALPLSSAAALITLMRLRDAAILVTGAVMLPGLQRPDLENEAAKS